MNDQKPRCQSCGMPLGPGFYGTNASGMENEEYCKFCFQKGGYTHPDLTLREVIQMSIDNMTNDLGLDYEKAHQLATNVIPQLKRWKDKQNI